MVTASPQVDTKLTPTQENLAVPRCLREGASPVGICGTSTGEQTRAGQVRGGAWREPGQGHLTKSATRPKSAREFHGFGLENVIQTRAQGSSPKWPGHWLSVTEGACFRSEWGMAQPGW